MKHFSIIKFHAITFTVLGLLAGIFYSVGGLIADLATTGINQGTLLAFGALIGMPIIGAIFGITLGIVELIIYSTLAKFHKVEYPYKEYENKAE